MHLLSKKEILLSVASSDNFHQKDMLNFEEYQDNFHIQRLIQNPEPKRWHPEGYTAKHIEMVFEQVISQFDVYYKDFDLNEKDRTLLKYAALFHDAWKPECLIFKADGSPSSPGHAELAAEQLHYLALELQYISQVQIVDLVRLVAQHMEYRKILQSSFVEQQMLFHKINPGLMCFFGACDLAGRLNSDTELIFEQAKQCYNNYMQETNAW
jgi:hypothetical protein